MADCRTGVKQGCNLSPTLFSIFANDLVAEVNDLDIGIKVGDRKLSLLLYADDIVLVAESEEKLQSMLDTVHSWCKQWRVLVNANQSVCTSGIVLLEVIILSKSGTVTGKC